MLENILKYLQCLILVLFKHRNNVLNIYANWDEVKVNIIQIYDVFFVVVDRTRILNVGFRICYSITVLRKGVYRASFSKKAIVDIVTFTVIGIDLFVYLEKERILSN